MRECKIPSIDRTRGFRLYTTDDRRLTDLYLDGGRCLIGHKSSTALNVFKNACERGLLCNYPNSIEEARFIKALGELFSGKKFKYYIDRDKYNTKVTNAYWLVLSFPLAPVVLMFDLAVKDNFPPSDTIPAAILAASTRSIYDYLAVKETRFSVNFPKIDAFFAKAPRNWRRQSTTDIHIFYSGDEDEWPDLFDAGLEAGFLFPPEPNHPLILNNEISDGEVVKLLGVLDLAEK